MVDKVIKSEQQWQAELPPEVYRVCRQRGAEPPYSGAYCTHNEAGTYRCACCGHPLFDSQAKFDFGGPWPTFWAPIGTFGVLDHEDPARLMRRAADVACARCGSHLGHVYEEGPAAQGLHYCIYSAALQFHPRQG